MRQGNGRGLGAGEGLRANLTKFGMRVGDRRPPGGVDLAGDAGPEEEPEGREASPRPWAIMPRQGRREGAGSARSVSSSELGIIMLTAAALAAVFVFIVFINAP